MIVPFLGFHLGSDRRTVVKPGYVCNFWSFRCHLNAGKVHASVSKGRIRLDILRCRKQRNVEFSTVTRASKSWIPELVASAGPKVTETYIDFFTSTIRNRNTRAAYARACWQFFDWCAAHGLELTTVRPFHVAAWIEDFPGSKPTVKQKLAVVRMLYDFLVVRQITPSNPAHAVRGPKYVVKKGKTPVWSREDAKTLLDSIPKDSVSGLRDLALIAAMFYSFARVSAVLKELVSYCASYVLSRISGWFAQFNASFYLLDRVLIRIFIKIFVFVI